MEEQQVQRNRGTVETEVAEEQWLHRKCVQTVKRNSRYRGTTGREGTVVTEEQRKRGNTGCRGTVRIEEQWLHRNSQYRGTEKQWVPRNSGHRGRVVSEEQW